MSEHIILLLKSLQWLLIALEHNLTAWFAKTAQAHFILSPLLTMLKPRWSFCHSLSEPSSLHSRAFVQAISSAQIAIPLVFLRWGLWGGGCGGGPSCVNPGVSSNITCSEKPPWDFCGQSSTPEATPCPNSQFRVFTALSTI